MQGDAAIMADKKAFSIDSLLERKLAERDTGTKVTDDKEVDEEKAPSNDTSQPLHVDTADVTGTQQVSALFIER